MHRREVPDPLPALAWGPLLVVAAVAVAVQATVASRYGLHRDELYFLEAGQHLAWSYVDQPPLVPALARIQQAVLGETVWAVRVVPALVHALIAILAGVTARELGAPRRGQVWAAVAIAGAAFVVTVGHLLSTATFDLAFWLVLLVIAVRLLRTDDPRWWLAYGAVAGVALWNKHLPVLLTVSLLTALLATRRSQLLRSRWLLLGGVVAACLAAPLLVWQATNGWPQLQMAGALTDRIGGENRVLLLPLQLLLLGGFVVPLAVTGARWLWRSGAYRPLVAGYAIALVLTFLSGGRPYYPIPLLALLVIAGTVHVDRRSASTDAEAGAAGASRRMTALLAANVLVSLPLSLPLLSPQTLGNTPIGEINDTLVETIGWRTLATQVAGVVRDLPTDETSVVLFAGSYGEAGALDRYGPELGLPEVYSGHNSYADWRRPTDDDATVVTIRLSQRFLDQHFVGCRQVATVDNGDGVDNEVQGAPISVCDHVRDGWDQRWDALRHLS